MSKTTIVNFVGTGTMPDPITFTEDYIILQNYNIEDISENERFSGWMNSATGSTMKPGEKIYNLNQTITLGALYTPDPDISDDFTYIFDLGINNQYQFVIAELAALNEAVAPIPIDTNGTFLGWQSSLTGNIFQPGESLLEYEQLDNGAYNDIYYTALWSQKTNYYKTADGWKPIKALYMKTNTGWQIAQSVKYKSEEGWR